MGRRCARRVAPQYDNMATSPMGRVGHVPSATYGSARAAWVLHIYGVHSVHAIDMHIRTRRGSNRSEHIVYRMKRILR